MTAVIPMQLGLKSEHTKPSRALPLVVENVPAGILEDIAEVEGVPRGSVTTESKIHAPALTKGLVECRPGNSGGTSKLHRAKFSANS
jgi:hypothetical protein